MIRALFLFALSLCFAHPLLAQQKSHTASVNACLSQHSGMEENCLDAVIAPCAEQANTEGYEDCIWNARHAWHRDLKSAESEFKLKHRITNPLWLDIERRMHFGGLEETCINRVGDNAIGLRKPELRAMCVALHTAAIHHLYTERQERLRIAYSDYLTEIESIAACVLESGAAGHGSDCVGLFREECDAGKPHDPTICSAREITQWQQVLDEFQDSPEEAELLWREFRSKSADCLPKDGRIDCMLGAYSTLVIDYVVAREN